MDSAQPSETTSGRPGNRRSHERAKRGYGPRHERLTADLLERQLSLALVRHTLLYGKGAPLVFFWIVGAGVFLVIWPDPAYAALWTGIVLVLAWRIVRDQRRNQTLRQQLLITLARARVPIERVRDEELRGAIDRGITLFAEVAAKALDLRQTPDDPPAFADVIADADGLVQVQCESARQVEELRRLLSLATVRAIPPAATGGTAPRLTDTAALHQRTIAALEEEAADAERLVTHIGQQLETLMLHMFQLERRASDMVDTAHITQQTGETLRRLHAIVDARRRAADEVLRALAP
jgi:hypothetical protein